MAKFLAFPIHQSTAADTRPLGRTPLPAIPMRGPRDPEFAELLQAFSDYLFCCVLFLWAVKGDGPVPQDDVEKLWRMTQARSCSLLFKTSRWLPRYGIFSNPEKQLPHERRMLHKAQAISRVQEILDKEVDRSRRGDSSPALFGGIASAAGAD